MCFKNIKTKCNLRNYFISHDTQVYNRIVVDKFVLKNVKKSTRDKLVPNNKLPCKISVTNRQYIDGYTCTCNGMQDLRKYLFIQNQDNLGSTHYNNTLFDTRYIFIILLLRVSNTSGYSLLR